ncbi:MAG: 3-dehydroquinate synthase [SAR324 cluster bacterium]|nr:3-dehydroquinate synthase [SAR324 cluster bacterium]
MDKIDQKFAVEFDFPVCFTKGLFSGDNPLFLETVTRLREDKRHRLLFVIDDAVAAAHPRLTASIAGYCAAHPQQLELVAEPVLVPGGEAVKNDTSHFFDLVELVNRHGIDRHSFLVIIGGGAVLDMACFAAAISHRNVRAIRVPTTVLSQDDSGVGVKNGINLFGKKNFIGTFHPPFAVLNDIEFISTLSHRDKIAGVAEAVKVALIRDGEFYSFLEANAGHIAKADLAVLEQVIRRCAELHMQHIRTCGDPFEASSARPLDYGHWVAHKMETITHNRLRHGEAVALGMAVDTVYAMKIGSLSAECAERIIALLEAVGVRLWDEELLSQGEDGALQVLAGLREFREHLGGTLHITLLRSIGEGYEVNEMDEAQIIEALHWLQQRDAGHGDGTRCRATSAAAG